MQLAGVMKIDNEYIGRLQPFVLSIHRSWVSQNKCRPRKHRVVVSMARPRESVSPAPCGERTGARYDRGKVAKQKSEEPQTGDRNWTFRSAEKGREGPEQEVLECQSQVLCDHTE